MNRSSQVRWAVGTLAVVTIALSIDSIRRTRTEFDAMHAPLVVIRHQLAAFSHNDYPTAYRCAAPEIQAQFPLSQFRRMVEQGYPQIAHARSASLGTPAIHGDTVIVPVSVTSAEGGAAFCLYAMRHYESGWRVAGVELDHTFLNPPALRHGEPARHPPKPREITAADLSQPESR
jgi:hypothetical protein